MKKPHVDVEMGRMMTPEKLRKLAEWHDERVVFLTGDHWEMQSAALHASGAAIYHQETARALRYAAKMQQCITEIRRVTSTRDLSSYAGLGALTGAFAIMEALEGAEDENAP